MLSLEKPGTPEELVDRYITTKVPLDKPGTPQELNHHGIKGMHWGIRKKEETSGKKSPKPISARREKRAQGREAHANRVQAQIDRIQANPSTHRIVQAHRDRKVRELQDIRDQHLQDAKDIREHNITRAQKRVLIGAGVAAGVLATYGTYKLVDSGKAHALLNRGPLKESVHLLKKDMTPDEIMHTVVKPINPNYGELGTKMNCRRCTFAYELRRRGYDVKATKSHSGTGQTAGSLLDATDKESNVSSRLGMIRQLMKEQQSGGTDTKFTDFIATGGMGKDWSSKADFHLMTPAAKSADLFNALAQQGNKARGEVGMTWNFGGGHSMAYEVINNVPHVFDTQTGDRYNLAEFTEKIAPTMAKAGATRLDNVNLNGAFLEKWIRNVK